MKNKAICRFLAGDTVRSKQDVWHEDGTPPGGYCLGKETYIVSETMYWEPGEGYVVYGESSDKRDRKVWHHEDDLELVKSSIIK